MNINCTNNCAYQYDGKCTMDQVPDISGKMFEASISKAIDCPYGAVLG